MKIAHPAVIRMMNHGRGQYHWIWTLQGRKCFYCTARIVDRPWTSDRPNGYTRDHVWPKSRYPAQPDNIVLSCHGCNMAKGDREPRPEEIARAMVLYEDLRAFIAEGPRP